MTNSSAERFALHAANPLLVPLGPYIGRQHDWIKILAHDPLKDVDIRSLTPEHQIMLLEDLQSKFEPTRRTLDVAADLQDMMRSSLRARNPLIVEARIAQNVMLSTLSAANCLETVPWFNTSIQGKMIYGVTGLGKTHPVQRFIDRLPPVHVHPDGSVPGWKKVTQIPALYLKMTHDGYRGGFLQAILIAVDQRCGTDYSTQYRKEKVETLAVRVGQILLGHCVGLLVIDDIQVKNFALSPDRDALLLLFLKLLDFGIPVVLIGSPLAFVDIQSFSQDNRRLTTSEPIEYMPFDTIDAKDWGDGLLPSSWRHNVMKVPTSLTDTIKNILHTGTAGFPHYLRIVCVGVQKYSIRRGYQQVTEPLLMEYLAQSNTLESAKDLLHGFRDKDPHRLSAIEDVPWMEYGVRWGKISLKEVLESTEPVMNAGKKPKRERVTRETRLSSLQRRAAVNFAADLRRKRERAAKNGAASKSATAGDIRAKGLAAAHVDGMNKLREQAAAAKG
jgi:hypothetical protein